ncbi:TolC family protein [Geopsychrobacter electrodiphilus]|uniref:TolC family protein n=1 Tax=Geopsychrobacter electrodiphilus TaxID=225196 RepID=UPI00035D1F35|nr:TolC family protein [Geopsychrobacter electrodiphilus]
MTRKLLCLLLLLGCFATLAAAEPLTLEDCLQRVREQNPDLLAAASGPRLAATAAEGARSAYRPQVQLSAGYTEQQAPQQVVIGGNSAQTQDQGYAHLSLGVDQLVYDFGRTSGGIAAAAATSRAAAHAYASTEQDLLLQTLTAYYRVLNAASLLKTAKEEVNQTEAHLHTAQALFDQGVVTRNDLLQAEVRLASSRQQVLARAGSEENAWLTLNYLTARPPEARGELSAGPLPSLEPETEPTATRPDLLAQSERIESAQEALRQAKGDYRPELFAHLGADYVENSYVQEQTIYSTTVGLRMTLYNGGLRNAKLRQAEENVHREQQRLTNLQQRARLETQSARNDARVAAQQIAVAQSAIRQAEENLRINQNRYKEQIGTATDVLDAQTLLTQAKTDLVRTQFDYQVAVARVRHAAGQL